MLACADNCVQESRLRTSEITKRTDLSFQFVLMGFFSLGKKKKKAIEISLLKVCMPNFNRGLICLVTGKQQCVPPIMKISICMTDPSIEGAEQCTVSVQLLQLLQHWRVCTVWNRRIASLSTWHKALLRKANSE